MHINKKYKLQDYTKYKLQKVLKTTEKNKNQDKTKEYKNESIIKKQRFYIPNGKKFNF